MLDNCGFNLEEGFVICPHTIGKESGNTIWASVYYTPSILEGFKKQYETDNSFISPNAAYFAIASKK